MEINILIFGMGSIILFYLIDKNHFPATGVAKKYLISRLEDNKKKELLLQAELEALIRQNEAWMLNAFPGSDITYAEYIETVKEKHSIEYSDSEFESLRTKRMVMGQVMEYLDKIKSQQEAIAALEADVEYQKQVFTRPMAS